MNLNFKKLLPKVLQPTRWGEYIEAVQSVLETIRTDKVNIIKNQYLLDEMSDSEIQRISKELGYAFKSYEGYTSETEYKLRQLLTVIPRIINKTLSKGYKYISKIYNLTDSAYPLYYKENRLAPILDWETFDETTNVKYVLDRAADNGYFVYKSGDDYITVYETPKNDGLSDLYLDDLSVWESLDQENFVNQITRHILYSFQFNYIENENEYMSENTARSLYYDIVKHKRRSEVVYFEPYLQLETNFSGLTKQIVYTWDKLTSGEILSVCQSSGDITSGAVIRFGDNYWGENYLSSADVTDVSNFLFQIDLLTSGEITSGNLNTYCDIYNWSNNELYLRKWIVQKNKTVQSFSELAILDQSSACIYYAEFPKINFYEDKMYTNVSLKINLI